MLVGLLYGWFGVCFGSCVSLRLLWFGFSGGILQGSLRIRVCWCVVTGELWVVNFDCLICLDS